MILYNHHYNKNTNEITITPVEVSETEKTYRAQKSEISFCRKTIKKTELNILHSDYGLYMVSKEPLATIFKEKIIEYYEEMHSRALEITKSWAVVLSKAKECTFAPVQSMEAAE